MTNMEHVDWVVGSDGPELQLTPFDEYIETGQSFTSTEFTIAIKAKLDNRGDPQFTYLWTRGDAIAFGIGRDGVDPFGCWLSDGTFQFYGSGYQPLDGADHVWAVRRTLGADLDFWTDGDPLTGSSSTRIPASNTNTVQIGAFGAAEGWEGRIGITAYWDRAVPDAIVVAHSKDPYGLLRLRVPVFKAGAPPTGSALRQVTAAYMRGAA